MARVATVLLARRCPIVLGIAFKGQNVAFMVGLAFAIAASANFPALVLSIFWRPFTTRGAQASMIVGTVSALVLIYLSPDHPGGACSAAPRRLFPLANPGLVTIPLVVRWWGSWCRWLTRPGRPGRVLGDAEAAVSWKLTAKAAAPALAAFAVNSLSDGPLSVALVP